MTNEFESNYFKLVYVLKLEDDCYYVGYSSNLNIRLCDHFNGKGSKWTMLHKPISIYSVCMGGTTTENRITLDMINKFGYNKVRGGNWCKLKVTKIPINYFLRCIKL